jgi:hypothetical protein
MDDIIIVAIVFGSLLGMLKLILDFVAARRAPADRSMTASELTETIDEAVDRSTRELQRRIENLEAIAVDQPISSEARLLDDHTSGEEIQTESMRQGQRVRS